MREGRLRRLLLCALLYPLGLSVLLPRPVRAQETVAEQVPGMKSGTTALLWSLLGTAVPAAAGAAFTWESSGTSTGEGAAVVLVSALIIGPSLGHFYAARPGRAFAGIGIRALAGAAAALGGSAGLSEQGATSGDDALVAAGILVGGAALVWDILRAPHSAAVHNDKIAKERSAFGVSLMSGASGLGLRAEIAF